MYICIASDHAGFTLKNDLLLYLKDEGHDVEDMGPYEQNLEDDYPDYCMPLAKKVAHNSELLGIVIGFSGQGEAMSCNRVLGARAAVYYGPTSDGERGLEILKLSREHNNANILSLGAKFLSTQEAKEATAIWLMMDFSHSERHQRRIDKLDK